MLALINGNGKHFSSELYMFCAESGESFLRITGTISSGSLSSAYTPRPSQRTCCSSPVIFGFTVEVSAAEMTWVIDLHYHGGLHRSGLCSFHFNILSSNCYF